MKKRLLEIVVVIVILFVLGYLALNLDSTVRRPRANGNSNQVETNTTIPLLATASGTNATAATSQSSTLHSPTAPATNTATETPPAIAPGTVLDNCRVIIHNYNAAFGENPVGDNAEITAALTGKNPRGVNFLREDAGLKLNDKGELLDGYGTPFFFHQVSAKIMEIRSAGLDKVLWTFDDEVTR